MPAGILDDTCGMPVVPELSDAEAPARPTPKKTPPAVGDIFRSLSMTGLRVICAYILLPALSLTLLTAIHFPYQVDELSPPKARKEAASFYTDIYSPPAVAQPAMAPAAPEAEAEPKEAPAAPKTDADSKYVKIAREAIGNNRIVSKVTAFARQYDLARKRVLDVGAGTGYLQDIVPDYVGLDISPSARRYFHKPFVEASATSMPFRDNEFDAAWSVWVLEHVPKPEQALVEIRRVVKDGGLLFLKPAWNCPWWLAQGYEARPYSDFGAMGKMKKASLNLLARPFYRGASQLAIRSVRQMQVDWSGRPSRFHYRLLQPNYEKYWVADSDAVNDLDYYETLLWFTSRGDECLNCGTEAIWRSDELIVKIHKR
jgi:SAM-dependent methyltransferase